MIEKFALYDVKTLLDPGDHHHRDYVRSYQAIVNCGTGPVTLRLNIVIYGDRYDSNTMETEPYGQAHWSWEMIPSRRHGEPGKSKYRGRGDTDISVTFDDVWKIITAAGLPADYSFV